ncbi:ABC transporter permease [Pontibacter akesuensis]|uniref:Putative ABC transport system permease protein n=1 Tax=Pontibacter akesuensis TaxID=388950 RepID=A0A1I7H1J0_9BACT|nr:ABC transporter permease [Pontibacter akesuensis]GHA54024.1 ABC transporter permease [Pontibacter akesuensis]SFU54472.1 putative ABC transport system permease protein [Pontibacter akesuensis]
MLKNYFLLFFRNMARNKVYAGINIIGLAIGIASCILIYLFVQHELSFDKAFTKHERIYRVVNDLIVEDEVEKASITHAALAPTLADDFPEIEASTRMINRNKQVLRLDDKAIAIENTFWADSNYFDLFDYKLLEGNAKTALMEPNTMVITKEVAGKFFDNPMDAMFSTLRIGSQSYKVTGIFEPVDAAHMRPNVLTSFSTIPGEVRQNMRTNWFGTNSYTYLLLRSPGDAAGLQAKLPDFVARRITPARGNTTERVELHLQALADIHLETDYLWEPFPVGNKSYIYIFSLVGILILLIASINYMNLATARSAKRAKEVGLRKVVGANRPQLILQFLSESVMLTLFAVVIALVLVELMLPTFNSLAEKQISSTYFLDASFILVLVSIAVFIGLVAGSYPAFVLSHFKPVDILKSDKTPSSGGAMLRKGLVVLQFTISLVMIIGTVVVYSQMHYLKNQDLGFTKEQVLVIDIPSGDTAIVNKMPVIKAELLRNANITNAATTGMVPGEETSVIIFAVERNKAMAEKTMNTIWVDYDFFELMDIPLKKGRNFSEEMRTDLDNGFILNEAAAKALGWDADPIGKRIGFSDTTSGKVIGVVKDFNYKSLHSAVEPLVILLAPQNNGSLMARISPGNFSETMAHVESTWQRFAPTHPMDYSFLDQSFNEQYRAEEKMLAIFGYFALLTIIIACMGLFGLASFMAEQRTKEIGIRKVLGSSVSQIVLLLTKDFALLVVLAIILACPIAWYGMQQWLQDFAYRTPVSIWIFVYSGLVALALAVLTVSFKAARAAMSDPVSALRTE